MSKKKEPSTKDTQGKTLTDILSKSTYKVTYFIEVFKYTGHSGWGRKKQMPETFTSFDIAKLSHILELSPVEIFEALYSELTTLSPHEIPTREQVDALPRGRSTGQRKGADTSAARLAMARKREAQKAADEKNPSNGKKN